MPQILNHRPRCVQLLGQRSGGLRLHRQKRMAVVLLLDERFNCVREGDILDTRGIPLCPHPQRVSEPATPFGVTCHFETVPFQSVQQVGESQNRRHFNKRGLGREISKTVPDVG